MSTKLVVVNVDELQSKIVEKLKTLKGYGVFISLNKRARATMDFLKNNDLDPDKFFFIDCITSSSDQEVIHMKPDELDLIDVALTAFLDDIKDDKFIIIDSVATLLIYNAENKVAAFIKNMIRHSMERNVDIYAFSQKMGGEDLLTKIYNFFDEVES